MEAHSHQRCPRGDKEEGPFPLPAKLEPRHHSGQQQGGSGLRLWGVCVFPHAHSDSGLLLTARVHFVRRELGIAMKATLVPCCDLCEQEATEGAGGDL